MTFEERWRGRAFVSRLDAVFLFHAHVNDSSIANKLPCAIDDCNYAMLDGHVMSATVTSPYFPEGRWLPVNCSSSRPLPSFLPATRPPLLFSILNERDETRNHSILVDLRHCDRRVASNDAVVARRLHFYATPSSC